MNLTETQKVFAEEVQHGLTAKKKYLPSKYFYDSTGDELFVKIMHCEEYYPTNAEFDILANQSLDIMAASAFPVEAFDVIELGAGDGLKTRQFLGAALEAGKDITYRPIDISAHAVNDLVGKLQTEVPNLKVEGEVGDYFNVLGKLQNSARPKLILFLGSTIGNMAFEKAVRFLSMIANFMKDEDVLLIGFDLMKDPDVIRAAYDDKDGYTAAFNLNLLHRINHELGGNFDVSKFRHYPVYNPHTGTAKSYLISEEKQTVSIEGLNAAFQFEAWESIHTEISQKYNLSSFNSIAEAANLQYVKQFTDERDYFADVLFKKA